MVGVQMGVKVIDGDQGFAPSHSQGFRSDQSDQQRASQSRTICHCDGFQIGRIDSRLLQCRVDHWQYSFHVSPSSYFGHDASESFVQSLLSCHTIPQNRSFGGNHRRSRFVTGRFDRQNGQGEYSFGFQVACSCVAIRQLGKFLRIRQPSKPRQNRRKLLTQLALAGYLPVSNSPKRRRIS